MLKLKKLINESAPGFTKRKFGDPLPTLSDIMKNQAIQATINYQRGYPYKTHRTGTELESVNETTYPKKGQVVAIGKDGIKFKLVNITHGHVGIPDDPSGTSFEFHALNKKYGKEHFTKKNWDFAMKKGWITVESVNEDNIKFSKEEMSQLHKDGKVEKGGHTIEFNESTKEYGKTLDKIAKDRQLKSISKKDRDTLIKIAKLMKRANESVNEGNLKYVIQYKKDKNRYLSNKSRDVKKVKDALQFKSEKDAKNQLNGLDWQFRGNYKIVKLKESVEETQLRNMIREELTYLNEETEFKVFYKGIRFTVKGKDLYNAKKYFISKHKVPMSKWGTLAIMSKKSYDDQQFRYENINEAIVKPSKVQSEVNKIKKRLIKKAESGKFYENFGQKEVDKLEDKYIDISSYTVEMNKIRDILTDFRKWARNYSPN